MEELNKKQSEKALQTQAQIEALKNEFNEGLKSTSNLIIIKSSQAILHEKMEN